jgi:hypothetical protein
VFATYIPTAIIILITFSTFWYKTDSTPDRLTVAINCLLTMITYFIESRSKLPSSDKINSMDIWNVVCVIFVTLQVIEAVIIDFVYERAKQRHDKMMEAASQFDWKKEIFRNDSLRRRRRLNLLLESASVNRLPARMMKRAGLYDYSDMAKSRKHQTVQRVPVTSTKRGTKKQKRGYMKTLYEFITKNAHEVDKTDPKYVPVLIDTYSRVAFPLSFLLFNLYYWPALVHNPTTATLPAPE